MKSGDIRKIGDYESGKILEVKITYVLEANSEKSLPSLIDQMLKNNGCVLAGFEL